MWLIGLGLVLGSFSNAVIWRLHEQQRLAERTRKPSAKQRRELSIVSGRSMCIHCHHQLSTMDLIPIASYLWLRGKCRYCGKPIDDTPLAELLVPTLFVVSYIWWPYNLTLGGVTLGRVLFAGWLLCLVGFVILALYDLRWFLLPDRIVYPLIGLSTAMLLTNVAIFHGGWPVIWQAVWGVLLTAGLFYVLYLASRGRWIGFGDVKLAIALGMLAGGPTNALLLLFIASLAGSLAALPLLLQGKPIAHTRIPFGPFLLLATVIVVLFGATLGAWYTSLLIL